MKIPNEQESHQIAFNHLLGISYEKFKNLYKKCTLKLYSLLLIDTTLASGNPLSFRENILESI